MNSHQTITNAIKLFLVDDHHVFREGLRVLIDADPRINVIGEAGDGSELIVKLEKQEVDVLLLDIDMPEITGLQIIDSIIERFPSINILVFSMHDNEKYIHQMLSKGAKGYLLKSCKKEELIRAITTVNTGDTYLSEVATKRMLSYIANEKDQSQQQSNTPLTSREIEVLKLVATGITNMQIGKLLHISHRTVDTHRRNIMEKLNLHNAVALTNYVIENNI